MTETRPTIQLEINHTYQLIPLDKSKRRDGVIYISTARTFFLRSIFSDATCTIECTTTGKEMNVPINRLRHY